MNDTKKTIPAPSMPRILVRMGQKQSDEAQSPFSGAAIAAGCEELSKSGSVAGRLLKTEDATTGKRRRGRPPTNPVRVKPLITAKDVLPAARQAEDIHRRPMIWQDLPEFAERHSRSSMEMMYDLGFNTTHQYTCMAMRAEVLPFDLELLVRIYDQYPSSTPWRKVFPSQAIDLIYGDIIETHATGPQDEAAIRMLIGQRLAGILDRSVTVLYRWLTNGGASSRRAINILSKVNEMGATPAARRIAFEGIALPAWRFRGIDIEQIYRITPEAIESRHMKEEVFQRLMNAQRNNTLAAQATAKPETTHKEVGVMF